MERVFNWTPWESASKLPPGDILYSSSQKLNVIAQDKLGNEENPNYSFLRAIKTLARNILHFSSLSRRKFCLEKIRFHYLSLWHMEASVVFKEKFCVCRVFSYFHSHFFWKIKSLHVVNEMIPFPSLEI